MEPVRIWTLIDRDMPVAKSQAVLIRVHAAAVNLIDLKKAAGAFKDFMPLSFPWIPGVDFSGIIESVGSGVTGYQVGDEVYGEKMEGGCLCRVPDDRCGVHSAEATYVELCRSGFGACCG
jgi:NADPH:quinone reductase-like Zn-dependent oxidoreductase